MLQQPTVIYGVGGVPAEVHQFDDHIAVHRPGRHSSRSRGRTSVCTNRLCTDPAVIDKRVPSGFVGAWRAICLHHGRLLTERLSGQMAQLVTQMLDHAEQQQQRPPGPHSAA